MLNKTLTPTGQFTSTQYDYDLDLDAGFSLHVTADNLKAANERVERFLDRLRTEEAKGTAGRFLEVHDAVFVPLTFYLRNRAVQGVSCWLTRLGSV
jgi:hypothetical protein